MSQDRIHALAFNELTAALSMYSRFVPLSEREQITRRVLAAVTPEIRAQASKEVIDRAGEPSEFWAESFRQGLLSAAETVSGGGS